MKLSEIAAQLGVSDVLIRKWKFLDKWDEIPTKRPRGAPKGNKNAVGNNGGAPPNNTNAMKHGMYRRYLPDEMLELMKEVENLDPLDMLWQGVELAFGKMMWAQRIMFVRDKKDETKVLKKFKEGQFGDEKEWEYQHAWDKQANDLRAFAAVNKELRSAIKQFLAASPEHDERRLKLELMQEQVNKAKAEVEVLKGKADNGADDDVHIIVDYGDGHA
jgi:uncharacterized protein YjcR